MQSNAIPARQMTQGGSSRPSMRPVFIIAALAAVLVFVVCLAMRPSDHALTQAEADRSIAQFTESIDALSEGREPNELTTPVEAWPVRNPVLSALGAFVAVLIVGRLYVFMRRLEGRA